MTSTVTPIKNPNDVRIFQDIENELNGNARMQFSPNFNSKNTLSDWLTFTNKFIGRAGDAKRTREQVRSDLVKAAGLLFSTIAALDTNTVAPRHFETNPNSDPTGDF